MSARYAFANGLKEVRFHLCQQSEASSATRNFLLRSYPTMKKQNPHTPIMIREALGVEPKVWARYDFGKERMELLTGLDEKGVEDRVSQLLKSSL